MKEIEKKLNKLALEKVASEKKDNVYLSKIAEQKEKKKFGVGSAVGGTIGAAVGGNLAARTGSIKKWGAGMAAGAIGGALLGRKKVKEDSK